MRATKTTIRFKLSRAEDARALEYLRNRKAAGSSFSKSVVQAINDCLDAQEAESREDSFMGRFRLMLREELKGLGNTVHFQPVSEPSQPSQAWNDKMTAFFRGNAINVRMSQNDVPTHLMVCDGKIGEYGGTSCRKRRQKGEYA